MIKLFNYEGYVVTVEPEAIMLAPFKAIYDRDKRKDKSMAMQELAYIYFMSVSMKVLNLYLLVY